MVMIKSEESAQFYSYHIDPNSAWWIPIGWKIKNLIGGKYGFSLVKKNKIVEENKELCLLFY